METPPSLNDLVDKLGQEYRAWKEAEGKKDELRKEFFKLVTEEVSDQLEEKYVTVTAILEEDVRDYVAKKYPRWEIIDLRPEGTIQDLWEVIIEENPEYKTYSYVDHDHGYVYTKQVSSGSMYVDDERLQQKDPDLYEQVTYVPEPERKLRSLEELEPELLARLSEYLYEGRPKVSLAAPRKAKPEELG